MARFCPETGEWVVYLVCMECETKECKKRKSASGDTEKDKENNKK